MKTVIGGCQVELFGKKELSERLTKMVQYFLEKGYLISYGDGGTQGEKTKIDLTNDGGKTIVRIWMNEGCEYMENYRSVHVLSIFAKKYENVGDRCSTLWMDKGELIFKSDFYCIDDDKKIYTESILGLNNVLEIRKNRHYGPYYSYFYKSSGRKVSKNCFKAALPLINKQKGYKTVKLSDIQSISKFDTYYRFDFHKRSSLIVDIKKA